MSKVVAVGGLGVAALFVFALLSLVTSAQQAAVGVASNAYELAAQSSTTNSSLAGAVAAAHRLSNGRTLDDYQYTSHALNSNKHKEWNAPSIAFEFNTKGCTPKDYLCPDGNHRIVTCGPVDGFGTWIGLVLMDVKRVIKTGFAAGETYWNERACYDHQ